MALVKVIEVLSQSEKGWEDAAKQAIEEASKTVRNIKSLYVKDFQLVMSNGIPKYRLDAKLSFELEQTEHKEEMYVGAAARKKNSN